MVVSYHGDAPRRETTLLHDVGRAIAAARKASARTQVELAAQIGVSVAYLQSLEGGKRNVTLRSLVRVADALCIDIAVIFARPTV